MQITTLTRRVMNLTTQRNWATNRTGARALNDEIAKERATNVQKLVNQTNLSTKQCRIYTALENSDSIDDVKLLATKRKL